MIKTGKDTRYMMKVRLLTYTPQPEKIVAAAAKLCYSDAGIDTLFENMTGQQTADFLSRLPARHQTPYEHAVFTFGVEGVSRALLAQITRHRIASFSVQSQRYVRAEDAPELIVPPSIAQDEDALALFNQAAATQKYLYKALCKTLEENHANELMYQGQTPQNAKKAARKKANEDARFVLPNAAATKLITTMNARQLNNFFSLRCCSRAQWEIRALADEMLKLVLPVAPHLFAKAGPACTRGACGEGLMGCGDAESVRKKYKYMKEPLGCACQQPAL